MIDIYFLFVYVWSFPGLFFSSIFSHNSILSCYHLSSCHGAVSTPLMISLTIELSHLQSQNDSLYQIFFPVSSKMTKSINAEDRSSFFFLLFGLIYQKNISHSLPLSLSLSLFLLFIQFCLIKKCEFGKFLSRRTKNSNVNQFQKYSYQHIPIFLYILSFPPSWGLYYKLFTAII